MEKIREARVEDAEGIARVHVDSWRTTYRGLMADEVLDELSYERREQMWVGILSGDKNFTFVAEDEAGRIVGFIDGGPEREGDPVYKGELYAIYLLEECQGSGLGRRLTRALVEKLIEAGFSTMLVWVLVTNSARHFYEALGGQLVKMKKDERDGYTLDEAAYGWLDIHTIL
ncbi:MAG TPA: GNAT family N-acetyltransferase [Ktedonobacteraceae bacterium]|nr:GNAT family N-acetyltransferase [Ktedonobacteraceae bacterium]